MVASDAAITVAVGKGFGRDDLDEDTKYNTIFWRDVGQSNALVATAAAKASVGFFMTRLVIVRWQKILISMAMGTLGVICVREYLALVRIRFVSCRGPTNSLARSNGHFYMGCMHAHRVLLG